MTGHCNFKFILDGAKMKFKGTSLEVKQVGLITLNIKKLNQYFVLTLPNFHIRSLYSSNYFYDLFGDCYIVSSNEDLVSLSFVPKSMFFGDYFVTKGKLITHNGKSYNIEGKWVKEVYATIEGKKVDLFSHKSKEKFDLIHNDNPDNLHSSIIWGKVKEGIIKNEIKTAEKEKHIIEEHQRDLRRNREENSIVWAPEYFAYKKDERIEKILSNFDNIDISFSRWLYIK